MTNARFKAQTLIRLVLVVVVACVLTTILAGPRADAAVDGYGVSASTTTASNDPWHDPSLIEGRAVVVDASFR